MKKTTFFWTILVLLSFQIFSACFSAGKKSEKNRYDPVEVGIKNLINDSKSASKQCGIIRENKKTLTKLLRNEMEIFKAEKAQKWDKILKLARRNEKIFNKNLDWKKYYRCLMKIDNDNFTPHIIKYIIWQGDVYRIKGNQKKALKHYNRALKYVPNDLEVVDNLRTSVSREKSFNYLAFFLNYVEEYCDFLIFAMSHPKLAKRAERKFLQSTTITKEALIGTLSFSQFYLRIFTETKDKWIILYGGQPHILRYSKPSTPLDGIVVFGWCSKRPQYRQEIDKKTHKIKQCSNRNEQLKTYCKDLSKMECP